MSRAAYHECRRGGNIPGIGLPVCEGKPLSLIVISFVGSEKNKFIHMCKLMVEKRFYN